MIIVVKTRESRTRLQSFLESYSTANLFDFPKVQSPASASLVRATARVGNCVYFAEGDSFSMYSYVVEGIEYGFMLNANQSPSIGTPIKVVFDPASPERHKIDAADPASGGKTNLRLGSCNRIYLNLFSLVEEGRWDDVLKACKTIGQTFCPPSVKILTEALSLQESSSFLSRLLRRPAKLWMRPVPMGTTVDGKVMTVDIGGDLVSYLKDEDLLINALIANFLAQKPQLTPPACSVVLGRLLGVTAQHEDLANCALLADLWGEAGAAARATLVSYILDTKELDPRYWSAQMKRALAIGRKAPAQLRKSVKWLLDDILAAAMRRPDYLASAESLLKHVAATAKAVGVEVDLSAAIAKQKDAVAEADEEDRRKTRALGRVSVDPVAEPKLHAHLQGRKRRL